MKRFVFLMITILVLFASSAIAAENYSTKFVQNTNQFALNLYMKLSDSEKEQKNSFMSPYSISSALAIVCAGASEETKKEMMSVIGFVDGVDNHALHGALMRELTKNAGKEYELNIANALWLQQGIDLKKSYIDLVKQHYGGVIGIVDFTRDPETAAEKINKWVSEKTKEKIKNIVSSGTLRDSVRMIITNAVYFKGKWESEFDENETKNEPFYMLNGDQLDVAMMNDFTSFKYTEGNGYQVLQMPYKGEDYSMVVFLPRKTSDLPVLEKWIAGGNLAGVMASLEYKQVILSFPKFNIEMSFSPDTALKLMGLQKAFSEAESNFNGISESTELFIATVLQKAYIDVDEKGTEAAAATTVEMPAEAADPEEEEKTVVFKADHPFMFMIIHNRTGVILFMGRLLEPPKSLLPPSMPTPKDDSKSSISSSQHMPIIALIIIAVAGSSFIIYTRIRAQIKIRRDVNKSKSNISEMKDN